MLSSNSNNSIFSQTSKIKDWLNRQTLDAAASLEVNISVHEHASVAKDAED